MLKYILSLGAVLGTYIAPAQSIPDTTTSGVHSFLDLGGVAASALQTPFWLRSRQYGIVPLSSPAGLVRAGTTFFVGDPANLRRVHMKAGVEIAATVAQSTLAEPGPVRLLLPEAYASIRLGKFEVYAGRRREVFGLVDTLLTSGAYAWSGNALPMPKVQIGTRGFVPLGFTKGVVAINAVYAHGWFGNADTVQGSYLHQKAVYGRISLFQKRLRLYGGVLHVAQWGGRSPYLDANVAPNGQIPSSLQTYGYVILAKQPDESISETIGSHDAVNRFGNHLGSIDFAAEWVGQRQSWFAYYQHPFEDKSGVAFQNMPDGLYGLRWQSAGTSQRGFRISRITAEVLSTMDQSGPTNQGRGQYAGADDYFNNFQYKDGYTFRNRVIGTPFITRWADSQTRWHALRGGYGKLMINSNRVQALYGAIAGTLSESVHFVLRLSYSTNYGLPMRKDVVVALGQTSAALGLSARPPRWNGLSLSVQGAFDSGDWLPNTAGGYVSIAKHW